MPIGRDERTQDKCAGIARPLLKPLAALGQGGPPRAAGGGRRADPPPTRIIAATGRPSADRKTVESP